MLASDGMGLIFRSTVIVSSGQKTWAGSVAEITASGDFLLSLYTVSWNVHCVGGGAEMRGR